MAPLVEVTLTPSYHPSEPYNGMRQPSGVAKSKVEKPGQR